MLIRSRGAMCLTHERCGYRFVARWPELRRRSFHFRYAKFEDATQAESSAIFQFCVTQFVSPAPFAERFSGWSRRIKMSKRSICLSVVGLFVVVMLVFGVPVALPQMEQAHPVYVYVGQFQIPRANWAQYAEDPVKTVNPILERLLA